MGVVYKYNQQQQETLMSHSAILPCGRVNVKTGKFEYGNFYGFWGNDTCYEVYRTETNKIRVVATSGKKPIVPLGKHSSFCHDQTRRYLFSGVVIDVVVGDDGFRTLEDKYGKLVTVATYK